MFADAAVTLFMGQKERRRMKMLGKVSENVQKTVNSLTLVENRTKIAW